MQHTSANDFDIDSYKDDSGPAALGPKGPKIQTLIEVLRCGLARPTRSSATPLGGSGELLPSKNWTPIYYAVYHNREAALLHFLRVGHSPDDATGTGQPPLCIAVAMGHLVLVKILCESGANIQATMEPNGESALHLAIKTGRMDIMDVLLTYRPNLESRTTHTRETPLHYAAGKSGGLTLVAALLKRGANYETLNSNACTPAEVALQATNLHSAVAIISKAHGKRNKLAREKEMLLKHVERAQDRFSMNNELIADIFKASCDPDSTVLVEAIKRGEANLVEMFLEKGADPNRKTANATRPIFAAINCSGPQIVQLLIKHNVDLTCKDSNGLTVLQATLENSSNHLQGATSEIFEVLLANGADPSAIYIDGKTLLHKVASSTLDLGRIAHQLFEHGVKVNAWDNQGNTALHLATGTSCIEVLLKHGANVNLVNNKRLTPLLRAMTAAKKENEANLEPLIKASETRKADSDGKTALHLAAENGLEKTVQLLLRSRAETTVVDSRGRTPLLLAVLHHQWSIVPLLAIQPGLNSWDESGMTALHHIATSVPEEPSTWKDIASAAAVFCERGVSRSMRDRSGATPLIQAVKNLPEEGMPVVDVLLSQKGSQKSNCVGHQDHNQHDALYYAATLGKPEFVYALLKSGAPFGMNDWTPGKRPIEATSKTDKQTLRLLAERDWLRRAGVLQRRAGEKAVTKSGSKMTEKSVAKAENKPVDNSATQAGDETANESGDKSGDKSEDHAGPQLGDNAGDEAGKTSGDDSEDSTPEHILPKILPLTELNELLSMGLDPNALPKSRPTTTLLWTILNQTASPPFLPAQYLQDTIKLLHSFGADLNATTIRQTRAVRSTKPSSDSSEALTLHPITFLLEQYPTVDIDIITFLLDNGANFSTPSSAYNNRFPLHSATRANRIDIVDEFLTRHADADPRDKKNRTPVFIAAEKGFWEIAEELLRRDANPNALDCDGNTPLHSAAAGGSRRIVTSLLKKGAKASTENAKGVKALACVPEGLAEKEVMVALLQGAEEKEIRENQERKEKRKKLEKLEKDAQERERLRLERQRRENEQQQKQQQLQKKHESTSTSTSVPITITQAESPETPVSVSTIQVAKQVVSIRYAPSMKSQQAQFRASGISTMRGDKSLQSPRSDSGFSSAQSSGSEKSPPVLDRSKENFDKGTLRKKNSEDELAGWLAVSNMLDRL